MHTATAKTTKRAPRVLCAAVAGTLILGGLAGCGANQDASNNTNNANGVKVAVNENNTSNTGTGTGAGATSGTNAAASNGNTSNAGNESSGSSAGAAAIVDKPITSETQGVIYATKYYKIDMGKVSDAVANLETDTMIDFGGPSGDPMLGGYRTVVRRNGVEIFSVHVCTSNWMGIQGTYQGAVVGDFTSDGLNLRVVACLPMSKENPSVPAAFDNVISAYDLISQGIVYLA